MNDQFDVHMLEDAGRQLREMFEHNKTELAVGGVLLYFVWPIIPALLLGRR